MLIGEEHLRLLIGKSLLETITDAEVEAKSAALSGEHPTLSADQANMLARAQLEKAEADSDEAEEESQDDELGRRPKGMEEGWTDQDSDSFRTWMNTNRMTRQRAKKMNLELPEDMREKYGEDSDTYIDRANNQHVVAAYNKRSPRNSDGYGAEWLEQAIAKYDSRREELDAERRVRDNLEKGFGPIDTFDKFLQMRLNQANHKASIDANQGENVDTLKPVVPIRDLSSRYRLGLGITYLYHVNEFDGMGGANTDDHVQVPANRIKSLWSPSSTVMLAQPGFDPDAQPTENDPLPRLQYKEPQVDGAISLAYDPKTKELFMRQVQKDGEWEVVIKDVPYNNGFLWLRSASNEGRTEEAELATAATATTAAAEPAGTEDSADETKLKEADRISQSIVDWWKNEGGEAEGKKGSRYAFIDQVGFWNDDEEAAFDHYIDKYWPADEIAALGPIPGTMKSEWFNSDYDDIFETLKAALKAQLTEWINNYIMWTIGKDGNEFEIEGDWLDI